MTEGYAVTAQYYDAVAAEGHAEVDPLIAEALIGLDTKPGPVLDIGAGTGLTTRVIAAALPQAEILAIEPDPAMRPALMTRVCADPDLRRRVSILPMPISAAPLPDAISGAVLGASLVHFPPEARRALWADLAGRLAPQGRIVVEIQCPAAADMPKTAMTTIQVGRIIYQAWASARRIDADRQHWTMTYRGVMDGTEISRDETQYLCWPVSLDTIGQEAGAAGLTAVAVGTLAILSHRR